jgi:hypothetical protein
MAVDTHGVEFFLTYDGVNQLKRLVNGTAKTEFPLSLSKTTIVNDIAIAASLLLDGLSEILIAHSTTGKSMKEDEAVLRCLRRPKGLDVEILEIGYLCDGRNLLVLRGDCRMTRCAGGTHERDKHKCC